jgi:hypothetical protein
MGCILRGTGAKGKEEYSFGFGQDDLDPDSEAGVTMVKSGVTKGCGDVEKTVDNTVQVLTGEGGERNLFTHDGFGVFFLHYCSLCGIIISYSFSFLPSRNGKVAACRLQVPPDKS